uniref:Uncharacterized protein n=1 Tax=Anopheles coluzzii TaxID=1518534 RepID=A0A8W7PRE7_ANOCL
MAKSVLVFMATGFLLVPVLCYFAAQATPGRPYGGAGAPVYVGGGVRPVIARPGSRQEWSLERMEHSEPCLAINNVSVPEQKTAAAAKARLEDLI